MSLIDYLNDLLVEQGISTCKGRSMILWDYDEAASQFRYAAHATDNDYLKITIWDATPEKAVEITTQDAVIAKLQDEKAKMLKAIQYLCDCNRQDYICRYCMQVNSACTKCDPAAIMTALGIEEN